MCAVREIGPASVLRLAGRVLTIAHATLHHVVLSQPSDRPTGIARRLCAEKTVTRIADGYSWTMRAGVKGRKGAQRGRESAQYIGPP